jgi:hypothetical protein
VSSFSIVELVSATSKAILSEDEILIKLYVNTLSEVPNDAFSYSAAEGAKVQAKKGITPHFEKCEGDSEVKHVPMNITSISEIIELFTGNGFFILLCKELNKYQNHNQDQFTPFPKQ